MLKAAKVIDQVFYVIRSGFISLASYAMNDLPESRLLR